MRVVTVAKAAAGDTVALTGRVQPQTEINLSFRIDGRLIERKVDVGDRVRSGELLAQPRLARTSKAASSQPGRNWPQPRRSGRRPGPASTVCATSWPRTRCRGRPVIPPRRS